MYTIIIMALFGLLVSLTLRSGLALGGGNTATLNNGLAFQKVSFGLQVYDDTHAEQYTALALQAGVRNFFASVLAGNQIGFGQALGASKVPREDIFVCGSANTASCSGHDDCYRQTRAACQTNLEDLGAAGGLGGYLDMIMLDYPSTDCQSIGGQWAAFEEMLRNKTTKSIAVSNFSPQQLKCLPPNATVPAVNQLPYSVGHGNDNSVEQDKEMGGILVQAYSPLGSGSVLSDADVVKIGQGHNKSAAQVALRWIIQRNATFTTSSSTLAHFQEDLSIFDFELSGEEMRVLDAKMQDE
jgi:diketogulonate reductase-like aldo/keto reductase